MPKTFTQAFLFSINGIIGEGTLFHVPIEYVGSPPQKY